MFLRIGTDRIGSRNNKIKIYIVYVYNVSNDPNIGILSVFHTIENVKTLTFL